jgi:hypothetical protein
VISEMLLQLMTCSQWASWMRLLTKTAMQGTAILSRTGGSTKLSEWNNTAIIITYNYSDWWYNDAICMYTGSMTNYDRLFGRTDIVGAPHYVIIRISCYWIKFYCYSKSKCKMINCHHTLYLIQPVLISIIMI